MILLDIPFKFSEIGTIIENSIAKTVLCSLFICFSRKDYDYVMRECVEKNHLSVSITYIMDEDTNNIECCSVPNLKNLKKCINMAGDAARALGFDGVAAEFVASSSEEHLVWILLALLRVAQLDTIPVSFKHTPNRSQIQFDPAESLMNSISSHNDNSIIF